jgi:ribosome-associated translation inhibitor RaiA
VLASSEIQVEESALQVQLNTDRNIEGRDELAVEVEQILEKRLGHYANQLTRVEVHLTDLNNSKVGVNDKRCMLEARISGQQPLAVTAEDGSVTASVAAAADKLKNALETRFGRQDNR